MADYSDKEQWPDEKLLTQYAEFFISEATNKEVIDNFFASKREIMRRMEDKLYTASDLSEATDKGYEAGFDIGKSKREL